VHGGYNNYLTKLKEKNPNPNELPWELEYPSHVLNFLFFKKKRKYPLQKDTSHAFLTCIFHTLPTIQVDFFNGVPLWTWVLLIPWPFFSTACFVADDICAQLMMTLN